MDASNTLDRIMQKSVEKKAAAKQRKEEREEKGLVNKLIIERTPAGLYGCRYLRGPVPDELKGLFTRKDRIIAICNKRKIEFEDYKD